MTPLILQLSDYAKSRILSAIYGQVHSVYRKTINLSTPDGLLALQAASSPLSPISLITNLNEDAMEQLAISPEDPVVFTTDTVTITTAAKVITFSFQNAVTHNLKPDTPLSISALTELKEKIFQVLSASDSHGFDMIFNSTPDKNLPLMFQVSKNRTARCEELFLQQKYEESAEELSHLLGLGIGLTPSGDDFLCGMMASLHMAGQERSVFALTLKTQIADHLQDTIDISAAFLACALENQYSLAVNSLYQNPDCSSIEKSFSAIGHSSGIDTLCGIWFGLNLFVK